MKLVQYNVSVRNEPRFLRHRPTAKVEISQLIQQMFFYLSISSSASIDSLSEQWETGETLQVDMGQTVRIRPGWCVSNVI